MKKMLSLCLIIPFMMVSCGSGDEKPNVYDEFANNYYKYNPNGYDAKERWYKYNNFSTYFNFDKTIQQLVNIDFIGLVDFDKDKFTGKTSELFFEKTILELNDSSFVSKVDNETFFKENTLVENLSYTYLDETKNENKILGSNKFADKLNISFHFNVDGFFPNVYEGLSTISTDTYNPIYFTDEYVCIEYRVNLGSEGSYKNIKTEYYFDNNYRLYKVVDYISKIYSEKNSSMSSTDPCNYFSVSTLEICDEETIDKDLTFEIEKNYESDWILF